MADIREKFRAYLIQRGYKETTPSGNPSTVYDYIHRIERVCFEEGTDWYGLKERIVSLLPQYEVGGAKAEIGAKSHNAVISALRQFEKFTRQG